MVMKKWIREEIIKFLFSKFWIFISVLKVFQFFIFEIPKNTIFANFSKNCWFLKIFGKFYFIDIFQNGIWRSKSEDQGAQSSIEWKIDQIGPNDGLVMLKINGSTTSRFVKAAYWIMNWKHERMFICLFKKE